MKKKAKKFKRFLKGILILIVILSVIILPQHISSTVSSELSIAQQLNNSPLYAAHRGLSALYPQNSIPAFEAAAKAEYYAFECDAHTTADGKWVIMHNDTVDEMTNGSGDIETFTYKEIRKLSLTGGNSIENYDDLKIPSLEETLAVCDKYDIIPIIELKKIDVSYLPDFVKKLKKHNLIDKVILISFDFEYLQAVQKINNNIELMYLTNSFDKDTVDMCAENGNIGINFNYQTLIFSVSAFKYARSKGLKLAAWTVDNTILSDLMRLIGVDMVTTNRIVPAN